MKTYGVSVYVRASVAGLPPTDHYVHVVVCHDDEPSAVAASTASGFLAGLVSPVAADVAIHEVRTIATRTFAPDDRLLLAVRDPAALYIA